MKVSATMKKHLNEQIGLEIGASQKYLAMASWAEVSGYSGAASYFYAQSTEERDHMLMIIKYMNTIGASATIPSVEKPDTRQFKSLEGIIEISLKNEQAVTKAIHKMAQIAQKEGDYATFDFLGWFVKEQVHEESKFEDILQKFETIGRDGIAINEIDKILGAEAGSEGNAQSSVSPQDAAQ